MSQFRKMMARAVEKTQSPRRRCNCCGKPIGTWDDVCHVCREMQTDLADELNARLNAARELRRAG